MKRGSPTKYAIRTVMYGMVWITGSEAPWRELNRQIGKQKVVSTRFEK